MSNLKTQIENIPVNGGQETGLPDLVCFSHLRWNYVFQRPQHLLSRCAKERRVFYVEEPYVEPGPTRLVMKRDASGVWIAIPYLSSAVKSKEKLRAEHIRLLDEMFAKHNIQSYLFWYYTPMAVPYTRHYSPMAVVYDCMDELSAFKNASPKLKEYEAELFQVADLVFAGGQSLYEAKKDQHPKVYLFPSSIDLAHFSQARTIEEDPVDQAGLPHPRIGFFGVIDERMDLDLVDGIASRKPEWHLVMIGPLAKVDPLKLPRRPNIHYLGIKPYEQLPAYLAGWDVALLPFALNESTRHISPTKTPEYLAGGKPVVSTPIRDVIRPYGENKLVTIAHGTDEFVEAITGALDQKKGRSAWLQKVDQFLTNNSWDQTWTQMSKMIAKILQQRYDISYVTQSILAVTTTSLPLVEIENHSQPKNGHSQHGSSPRGVYDYLIVGAGFSGSVLAERLASGSGKKVLLIDRRPHVGGNAYDYYNQDGLLIHKYGPHIFHTNSREVFAYLSRFTQWRPYEHRVLASVDGQLVPMPINLDTINQLYGTNLTTFELEKFFESVAETKEKILTSEDVVVSKVGRLLYEKFFRNYTRKQWDLDPSELDASVTSRVPIRNNRDGRYFTDTYQAMPLHGYTQMFQAMLDHRNIHIMLNTDYRDIIGYVSYREVIFTGPVDEFFDYCYGKLPYRSLQFKFETLNQEFHQPVAVINYPNEHPYTRVTEFKYLTGQEHPKTSLVYEHPCAEGDPYYPIPRPENAELYQKYKILAEQTPGVHFAGRLATYKYYNMDQVTAQALALYARLAGISRSESISSFAKGSFQVDLPCSMWVTQDTE